MLVPCDQLRLETSTDAGQTAEDVDFYVDDGNVYYDQSLEPSDLLDRLAPVVGLSADEQSRRRNRQRAVQRRATKANRGGSETAERSGSTGGCGR